MISRKTCLEQTIGADTDTPQTPVPRSAVLLQVYCLLHSTSNPDQPHRPGRLLEHDRR